MGKRLRHFAKADTQLVENEHKNVLSIIREMQMEITPARITFCIPVPKGSNKDIPNVSENVEKLDFPCIAIRDIKWYRFLENSLAVSYEIKYILTL